MILLIIVINKVQESCTQLFIINRSVNYYLDISPKNFIFLKTFDSEFSYIEVCYTDENSNPLKIEDKINVTLVIN